MSKSACLRAGDWRAILRLAGECRDLGDDPNRWRLHLVERVSHLVDADAGDCGETADHRATVPRSLGIARWNWENWARPSLIGELFELVQKNPDLYTSIFTFFNRLALKDELCLSRSELIHDRDWYRSTDYQLVQRNCAMDHLTWSFRSLPSPAGDEYSGFILNRAIGRGDFSARERQIIHEAHAATAPLIGGPLARLSDPSPLDLAPRVREVLACLLEGDSDKQVARRLRLSSYTVNQYTKVIYRHFGVTSRPELLARWIRRGWRNRYPLPEGESMRPQDGSQVAR